MCCGTSPLIPWMPCASWMDSANMGSQLCYQQQVPCLSWQGRSQSGGVQKLFLHIFCCALFEVTHPSPVTAHPTHLWSCKAVCLRRVFIGITILWTPGFWNHSTDRGVANSKWQQCMAVLTTPAIEQDTVMDRPDELRAKSNLCYCRLCGIR